ncbi:MAG TPA: carbohydrate porin [Acetobacteraceae bacterium]|nr:carbohydrate porin [Acetobacteraceae bacterium]
MRAFASLARLAGAACLAVLGAVQASAQTAPPMPQNPAPGPSGQQQKAPTGLWERSNLLGDPLGARSALADRGLSFGLSETSEVLGNVTGGVHTGAAYDGVTMMSLGVDTSKAFGWDGGILNISALQIHGRDLSTDNLYVLQPASSIAGERTTRIWELWYQQSFLGGKADLKLGQQSLDQEFLISAQSGLFINAVMGWPALPTVDMYAGGPAYPLSSLGIRLRAEPSDTVTVLGGVFDDNPPGGPFYNDNQLNGSEAGGHRFNLGTRALFIAEVQYALNPPPASPPSAGAPPPGLPGTYKLGFWYDTGAFPSQNIASDGLPLASSASTGIPQMLWNNFSLYGVIDQTIWRPDPQGARALGLFLRAMGAPGDRNLVNFSMNAGVTLKAPLPGRDNDTTGIGIGYARISGAAAQHDQQLAFYTGTAIPIRSAETFIEATYQAQLAPWWIVQPDIQYFINPSGGILNPLNPTEKIKNELVLGLRTNVTF